MIQPPHNTSISADTLTLELVIHIQKRDELAHEAFRELHRRFDVTIRVLLRSLISLVPDRVGVVEELHQDIFLRVWLKLPSKDENTPFEGWLRIVAKNVACDYFRRRKLDTIPFPEDERGEDKREYHDMAPFSVAGPEEQVCREDGEKEFRERVEGVLAGVSKSRRARLCITLYFIWGFSQNEIAELLGIDKKRISDYVCKGREELRQAFS